MFKYNDDITICEAIEISYLTWNSEKHIRTPKYNILRSFEPLVKNYHVSYVDDDDKPLNFTCQHCNGFVRCAGKSDELLYINFFHAGMSTL